jgi:hypothetical protein
MKAGVFLLLGLWCGGCANGLHEGASTLSQKERGALKHARQQDSDRFDFFWVRPDTQPVPLSLNAGWSAIPNAPATFREHVRASIGRAFGARAGEGAPVDLTVVVFSWDPGARAVPPRLGVEIVGRGPGGEILWMGEGLFYLPRPLGRSEDPGLAAAEALTGRLRKQFGEGQR